MKTTTLSYCTTIAAHSVVCLVLSFCSPLVPLSSFLRMYPLVISDAFPLFLFETCSQREWMLVGTQPWEKIGTSRGLGGIWDCCRVVNDGNFPIAFVSTWWRADWVSREQHVRVDLWPYGKLRLFPAPNCDVSFCSKLCVESCSGCVSLLVTGWDRDGIVERPLHGALNFVQGIRFVIFPLTNFRGS